MRRAVPSALAAALSVTLALSLPACAGSSGGGENGKPGSGKKAPCPPPENLVAAAGDASVSLDWNDPGDCAEVYRVYWSTSPGVDPAVDPWIPTTARSLDHLFLTSGRTYHYRITSLKGTRESDPSPEVCARPLRAPTNVQALPGPDSITVSWAGSPNPGNEGVTFSIYEAAAPGVPTTGAPLGQLAGDDIRESYSFTHTGLAPASTHHYVVTASHGTCGGRTTGASTEVSATIGLCPSPPSEPTGLDAVTTTGAIALSWTGVGCASEYLIYWLENDPNVTRLTGNVISPGTGTDYVHTGLNDCSIYYYVVTARNSAGESAESGQDCGMPIGPPDPVDALAGIDDVTVTWSPVTCADSYNIYWSTSPGVDRTSPDVLTTTANTITHSGLAPGTTYHYVVTAEHATCGGAESIESVEVMATPGGCPSPPPAPTGLATVASTGEVSLSWDPVPGAIYVLYWLENDPAVSKATGNPVPLTATSYLHTGLTDCERYDYVVTAVVGSCESDESTSACGRSIDPPDGVMAAPGNTEVTVSWDAASVACAAEFRVYWSTGPRTPVTKASPYISSPTSPVVHSGRTNGETYNYAVTALHSDPGCGAAESLLSPEVSATPTNCPPLAPPDPLIGAAGDEEVTLDWPLVPCAASYNIYWDTSPGVTKASGTKIAGASPPYLHGGLTNCVTYFYVVTVVDGTGAESAESNEVCATPIGPPVILRATPGDGEVTVEWTSISCATGGYRLYWSVTSPVTKASNPIPTASTTYVHSNRMNGTTYFYAVLAIDSSPPCGGTTESALSAEISATPTAAGSPGTLDTGFGSGGIVTDDGAAGGAGDDGGNGLALDCFGRIVVAGWSRNAAGNDDMAIWRLDDLGALDGTFGAGGAAISGDVAGAGFHDRAEDVAIDLMDRPVAGGWAEYDSTPSSRTWAVTWRFTTSGTPDTAFDLDGVFVHPNALGGANEIDVAYSVAVDASGRILLGGAAATKSGSDDLAVWCLLENGSLDTTFDGDGLATHDKAAASQGNPREKGRGLVLDASGNVIVAGHAFTDEAACDDTMTVWKYLPDGSLDTSFDSDGWAVFDTTDPPVLNYVRRSLGVTLDGAGRIIATGGTYDDSTKPRERRPDLVLWSYWLGTGQPDVGFDGRGFRVYPNIAGGDGRDSGFAVAVDSSNRILVTGLSHNPADDFDMHVMRVLQDGTVDALFGTSGVFLYDSGLGDDSGNDIALDAQGRIVVSGYVTGPGGDLDLAIWRIWN